MEEAKVQPHEAIIQEIHSGTYYEVEAVENEEGKVELKNLP